jgi:hypothetical protein
MERATWCASNRGWFVLRRRGEQMRYYPADDTYTVSDMYMGVAQLNRQGEILMQARTDCQSAPVSRCATANMARNHGHQLLPNGNLLYFSSQNAPRFRWLSRPDK